MCYFLGETYQGMPEHPNGLVVTSKHKMGSRPPALSRNVTFLFWGVASLSISLAFSPLLSSPLSPFPSWEYESEEDERGTSSFLCFLLSCQDDGTMTVTPVLQLKCSQNYKPCLMSWLPWHGKTNGVNATKLLSDPALPVIIAVSLLPTNSYWCLKTQLLTNLSCEHHSITDMKMDVGLSLLPCPVELLIGGVIWGCWVWCASSVVLFLKDEIQRPSFSEAVVCLLSFYQTADGAK